MIRKKKINGMGLLQQPKNTVAMLNELRQGLIYHLESQVGPVHAPIFTMTVEVSELLTIHLYAIYIMFTFANLIRWMDRNMLDKEKVKKLHEFKQQKRHSEILFN